MKVIVVTGGIGSGKSEACRHLNDRFGWPVYNADQRVKQLYQEHPSLLADIESALGLCLRDEQGLFVPSRLAAVIFYDKNALARVEGLVFPVLTEDFQNWKNDRTGSSAVILESATILEKGELKGKADVVVLIDAPFDVRLKRASERDAASEDAVLGRMRNQVLMNRISDGLESAPADYVILNDGSLPDFHEKLEELAEIAL